MQKSKILILLLFVLFVGGFIFSFTNTVKADSWLTGWNYRKKITISKTNVDADLANFPALVKITADSDMSTALATGYDIRFTDSDGATLLKYERESWSGGNGTAGTGIFWVKVPIISHSANTDIYVYYGKSDATDGQDATNVWDSNFKGVWHLNDPTNPTDSTLNANNGTNHGVTATIGETGGAGSFDGTDDYINLGDTVRPLLGGVYTVSAWIKLNSIPTSGQVITYRKTDSYFPIIFQFDIDASGVNFTVRDNALHIASTSKSVSWSANSWYLVTGVRNGNTVTVYANALASTPNTAVTTIGVISPDTLLIGAAVFPIDPPGIDGYFPGIIDDVRISSTARSAEWIKFEYNNMNSSNNELAFAVQQHPPAPTPTNLTATVNNSQSITLNVDTFTNSTTGSSGYYFERTSNTQKNSGWIQTNTWTDTDQNFSCSGESYTVKYRNQDAVETATITVTAKPLLCGGGGGGGGVGGVGFAGTMSSPTETVTPTQTTTTEIATSPSEAPRNDDIEITRLQTIIDILRQLIQLLVLQRGM